MAHGDSSKSTLIVSVAASALIGVYTALHGKTTGHAPTTAETSALLAAVGGLAGAGKHALDASAGHGITNRLIQGVGGWFSGRFGSGRDDVRDGAIAEACGIAIADILHGEMDSKFVTGIPYEEQEALVKLARTFKGRWAHYETTALTRREVAKIYRVRTGETPPPVLGKDGWDTILRDTTAMEPPLGSLHPSTYDYLAEVLETEFQRKFQVTVEHLARTGGAAHVPLLLGLLGEVAKAVESNPTNLDPDVGKRAAEAVEAILGNMSVDSLRRHELVLKRLRDIDDRFAAVLAPVLDELAGVERRLHRRLVRVDKRVNTRLKAGFGKVGEMLTEIQDGLIATGRSSTGPSEPKRIRVDMGRSQPDLSTTAGDHPETTAADDASTPPVGEDPFIDLRKRSEQINPAIPRAALHQRVAESIRDGTDSIVLLHGLPGSGKSTILSRSADLLAAEFQHVLWVRVGRAHAEEPSYTTDVFHRFLESIGRGLDQSLLQGWDQQRVFRTQVERISGLSVLVCIDGIDELTGDWTELVIECLSNVPGVKVLATACTRPHSAVSVRSISIPPLTLDEAVKVLLPLGQRLSFDPHKVIARFPKRLWSNPRSLVILIAYLEEVPFDLLMQEAGMLSDIGGTSRLVQERIGLLTESELDLLSRLDLLEDVDIGRGFGLFGLAPPLSLVTNLRALISRSFVERDDSNYYVPAIVRDGLFAVAPEVCEKAASELGKAIELTLNDPERWERDTEELVAAVAQVTVNAFDRRIDFLVRLSSKETFLDFLNERGYWREYLLILRIATRAAAETRDRETQLSMGFRLVRKLIQCGEVQDARDTLTSLESLLENESPSPHLADLHSHRAELKALSGDVVGALEDLNRSRAIWLVHDGGSVIATIDRLIGNLHLRSQDYPAARRCYDRALSGDAASKTTKEIVECETSLAVCDAAEGLFENAERRLRQVITSCEESHYPMGIPRAKLTLSYVLNMTGRHKEAVAMASEAAAQSRSTDIAVHMAAIAMSGTSD